MPRHNWLSWLLAALSAAFGLSLIAVALLPYGSMKALADALMPDGNFTSLKAGNAGVFRGLLGAGGVAFLGLAALTVLRRWGLVLSFFKQFWADARRFFAALRPHKNETGFLAALLVIMTLAVIYRLEYIYSSLHHDEAYTYVAFAHSLFAAATDYHLPNNHVFHSILVYFSTQLFGIQPWAVRLPAFTAGVLLVLAAYWLAKRLYDRWTALGAALLVTFFPALIGYSTNARGYTLVALFTLLTLALGDVVRKEKNLFAWGLISLFSALGFYSVPVMLFPFGVLFVWLFLAFHRDLGRVELPPPAGCHHPARGGLDPEPGLPPLAFSHPPPFATGGAAVDCRFAYRTAAQRLVEGVGIPPAARAHLGGRRNARPAAKYPPELWARRAASGGRLRSGLADWAVAGRPVGP